MSEQTLGGGRTVYESELEELSPDQRERRQRIIDATVQLASTGGFDGVQMRAVADRADVALGTLYRYFPSKIHLLVATLRQQTEVLASRIERNRPTGETAADRVVVLLRRANRALQREPELTEAMLRGMMAADSSAAAETDAVNNIVTTLIIESIHDDGGEPTDEDRAVARVIEHVWQSSLLGWLSGRTSSREMYDDLETAIRLLLRDR